MIPSFPGRWCWLIGGLALAALAFVLFSLGGAAVRWVAWIPFTGALAIACARPRTGVAVLIIVTPYAGAVGELPGGVSILQMICGATLTGWALACVRGRRWPSAHRSLWPVAALVVFAGLSVGLRGGQGLNVLLSWGQLLLLAVLFAELIREEGHQEELGAVLVVAASLLAVVVLWDYVAFRRWVEPAEWVPRFRWGGSPALHPFAIAEVVGLAVVAVAALAHRVRLRWQVVLGAAQVVLVMALIAVSVRTSWAAVLVGLAVVAVVGRARRVTLMAAAASGLLLVTLFGGGLALNLWDPGIANRATETVTSLEKGTSGRTLVWTVYGRILAEHPVTGVGLGAGPEIYEETRLAADPPIITYPRQLPHNDFLRLGVELGLVAPLLLAAAVIWAAVSLWRRRDLAAILCLGLLAFQLMMMQTVDSLGVLAPWMVLGIIAGAATAEGVANQTE